MLGRRPVVVATVLLAVVVAGWLAQRSVAPGSPAADPGPHTQLPLREPMSPSGSQDFPPSVSAAPPSVDPEEERGIPSYQWPDEIHPAWRENRAVAAKIDYMIGIGPVKMPEEIFSAVPFRSEIDDPSLLPHGFGEFVERGTERCSLPPPSRIDCSEAPCLAFLWYDEEDVSESARALVDCEPLNQPQFVGGFWVDCPTGRRWVVYFWQGNAWEEAVPDDVPQDSFWWRPILRVMREPPESYCVLP